jgi:hypothetical protein
LSAEQTAYRILERVERNFGMKMHERLAQELSELKGTVFPVTTAGRELWYVACGDGTLRSFEAEGIRLTTQDFGVLKNGTCSRTRELVRGNIKDTTWQLSHPSLPGGEISIDVTDLSDDERYALSTFLSSATASD